MGQEGEIPLLVDKVSKRYGDLCALDELSLEIRPGEVFALLGPNGAGKTTLIRCIAGLSRQSAGTISVYGHDTVRDFHHTRRLVGLVPQEIGIDPFFTPLKALLIQMGFMGIRPDRARAEALLETMSLTEKRDAYARTLSGGMKRRLQVAKSLVHEPRLLFLDEPTAGVDVELRKDLWAEVCRMRDRGTTIVLTTHYLEEAEELADRIGVLHKGRLILVEEREALMKRYRHGRVTLDFASVKEGASLPDGLPDDATLESERRLRSSFANADELESILRLARQYGDLADVAVKQTSLEDIFVDLIKAAEEEDAAAAREARS
jgi:ABC-2 type transport system ATP-binding protein